MISLSAPLEIEPETHRGGWQLWFFVGDACNYDIPFRAMLKTVAGALGQGAVIDLPPYDEDEDFVEGRLSFGDAVIDIYYEYSLSYLSLMHADRACLEDVMRRVEPYVKVG